VAGARVTLEGPRDVSEFDRDRLARAVAAFYAALEED
jgi:hypothetical protein